MQNADKEKPKSINSLENLRSLLNEYSTNAKQDKKNQASEESQVKKDKYKKTKDLIFSAYTDNTDKDCKMYKEFTIPKKSGGTRTIKAPKGRLKSLQKIISQLLADYYEKIIKEEIKKHKFSFGFIKGFSIINNAKVHKNKNYVFNLDLKDFFPSITYSRVYGYLAKTKELQKHIKFSAERWNNQKSVVEVLAHAMCHPKEQNLPQGAPSSPIMSNLIASKLDKSIMHLVSGLCKKYKYSIFYSRYADDLTFSCNDASFPEEIAKLNSQEDKWEVGEELEKIIKSSGFEINYKKVRMSTGIHRKQVTGLVVNKKVNIRRTYIRSVRSTIHKILCGKLEPSEKILQRLIGKISFISMVRKSAFNYKEGKDTIESKFDKKIIFIKYFLYNKYPTIFTEGKTDIMYLKAALRAFAEKGEYKDSIKDFIEKDERGEHKYKLIFASNDVKRRLYNYVRKDAKYATKGENTGGGGQVLNGIFSGLEKISKLKKNEFNFEKKYTDDKESKKTKAPVIFLLDRDKGSNSKDKSCYNSKIHLTYLPEIKDNEKPEIENYVGGVETPQGEDKKKKEKIYTYKGTTYQEGEEKGKTKFDLAKIICAKDSDADFSRFKSIFDLLIGKVEESAKANNKDKTLF